MKSTILLAAIFAITGVLAFWRMECHEVVGMARIDPLITPGGPSQHAHAIHGSNGFSSTSVWADLVNPNTCTSCAVQQDHSAYWHPIPYFKHANGTYEAVQQVGGMLSYYFLNTNKKAGSDQSIKAFPQGFRMIAGDSTRRNYSVGNPPLDPSAPDPPQSNWGFLGQDGQSDLAQRALGFNCLNYAKAPEASLYRHYLPGKDFLDANCVDGVRFELMFPSCWNGKDLDSPNHKDHVAYPTLLQDGECPDGFPVKLPGLFYEVIWFTYGFVGQPGTFVLSNGDVTGFGYHGDFIMGWDEGFLQQAVNTCTSGSGRIEDCPLFTLQDDAAAATCNMPSANYPGGIASENVKSPGTNLPGNVQIQAGPGPAIPGKPASTPATSVAAPTLGYAPGSSGAIYKEAGSTADAAGPKNNALGAVPTDTTAAPSAPPTPSVSMSTVGPVSTQWVTNGASVTEIIWDEEIEYVTTWEDATSTVLVTPTPAAVKKVRGEAHHHQHAEAHKARAAHMHRHRRHGRGSA